jgi:hypothetical protein
LLTYTVAASIHLSNLIPQRASRTRLSPTVIADYLNRAQLGPDHLALAACILDSLNSFFIRSWRAELSRLPFSPSTRARHHQLQQHPLTPPSSSSSSSSQCPPLPTARFSFPAAGIAWSTTADSDAKPELIVLAALQLATSVLDDVRREARWWTDGVALGTVAPAELNATTRCMLQNVDYDLGFPPEDVQDMKEVMLEAMRDLLLVETGGADLSEERF